ncbi:MAG: type II toxin-antitoxin system VapC family toxin, partial [Candidatus Acidiferrum sp.]
VLVSAASAWEIATKFRAGKLDDGGLVADFHSAMQQNNFVELQVSVSHAIRAGLLEGAHKDPFDRMLAAQAQIEDLPIISNDKAFDTLSVRRIW